MALRNHSAVTVDSTDSDQDLLLPEHSPTSHSADNTWSPIRRVILVRDVPHRILLSLVPPLIYPEYQQVYSDLRGPLFVVTTLATIILYGLHNPGQALAWELLTTTKLSLGYWLGFSLLAFLLGHCFGTTLSLPQLASLAGYSLTGHCLVLLGAELLHQEESHAVFFLLTTLFGGLATGRLILLVLARTPQPPHRLLMGSSLASIHLMHLIYIHFACMRRKFNVWKVKILQR